MDFKAKFNKNIVLDFLENQFLPEDFSKNQERINLTNLSFTPEHIQGIEFFGESTKLDLKLYAIQHNSENDPRVALSRDTFRLMSNLGAHRALVVFHSKNSANYRISLVTVELELKGTKAKREYSNPRRYSFFLGPDAKTHTPEQFLSKQVSDFSDLLGRFSIEVVNKDFYNKIAIKFTELVGGKRPIKAKIVNFDKPLLSLPDKDLSKPESHILAQEFAVRLIGRIVFCWFLKRKKSASGDSLLPESVLSYAAVTACDKAGDNYYHSVLENLFFQALNTEMAERGAEFKKAPYNKIPFLNGGLFEPHDADYYDYDSLTGSSRSINTLKVPNSWLKGLIEILETYNFTIDENTSVDVELSVDPEMLGRIFENLLAEINPETGETARKSTGSYYTPRSIVEYMVDESLKEYLRIKTRIGDNKLAGLLSYSENDTDLSDPEKEMIISALDEVKIIDPACGSGAFPMGMLQKIVLILQKVDPDSKKWLQKILDAISDTTAADTLRKKLEGEAELWNYTRKLGVIRKSIYGVDIQPIALEISKLRFFLSLVVDEKVDDRRDNRGIEHLPNLEFKFVCANALVGLPADTDSTIHESINKLEAEQKALTAEFIKQHNFSNPNLFTEKQFKDRVSVITKEIEKLKSGLKETKGAYEIYDDTQDIAHLKALRDAYFTASSNRKLKIAADFFRTQKKMVTNSSTWGKADTDATRLSQWDPFKNQSTPWFDPEWMFGVKGGFDIAIGNPPWGQKSVKFSSDEKDYFKKAYTSLDSGILDICRIFIEKAVQLCNTNGVFINILPDIVLLKNYDSTRKFMLETLHLKDLVYWGEVFDSVSMNAVTILGRKNVIDTAKSVIKVAIHCESEVTRKKIKQEKFFTNQGYKFNIHTNDVDDQILSKLKPLTPLESFLDCHEGIHTGNIREKLFLDKKEDPHCKKLIFGRNGVQRYSLTWEGKWVCYNRANVNRDKGEYAGLGKPEYYETNKIIVRRTGDFVLAALDTDKYYFSNNVFVCIPKNKDINLKYLVAVLNSDLATWFYRTVQPRKGKLFAELKINVLNQIPIKHGTPTEEHAASDIVTEIIHAKAQDPDKDTSALEKKLNALVNKVYEFTADEISEIEKRAK